METLNTQIQKRVTRSIFEHLRTSLIKQGYLIDVSAFIKGGKSEEEFNTTMQAVEKEKGFWIDIYNEGSPQARGLKKPPRLVVGSERIIPGDLGSGPEGFFFWTPEIGFRKVLLPYQFANLHISVTTVASTIDEDRVLNFTLFSTLGTKKHLAFLFSQPTFEDPCTEAQCGNINEDNFFIRQINYYGEVDSPEGIINRTYEFEVTDIVLAQEDVGLRATINEITVEPLVGDKADAPIVVALEVNPLVNKKAERKQQY